MDDETRDAAARHPSARPASDGERDGEPDDRGRVRAIGVDLERLRDHGEFQPVVEYLTAIQDMRGDGSSLLFVRGADLDAMAERDGQPVPEFIDRLDQLGVVVSSN
jgi:hypothetical protein